MGDVGEVVELEAGWEVGWLGRWGWGWWWWSALVLGSVGVEVEVALVLQLAVVLQLVVVWRLVLVWRLVVVVVVVLRVVQAVWPVVQALVPVPLLGEKPAGSRQTLLPTKTPRGAVSRAFVRSHRRHRP